MRLLVHPKVDRDTATSTHRLAIDRKAEERLRSSSYLALRDISCLASDDVLYLHGCLSSYYLKQVAQELAVGVEGVRHVVNLIEVFRPVGGARPDRQFLPSSKIQVGPRPPSRGGWSFTNTRHAKGVINNVGFDPQAE